MEELLWLAIGLHWGKVVNNRGFADQGYGYDVFGLHPPSLAKIAALCGPLYENYFRVESKGFERIPRTGPVIVTANHSGILPIDAAMLLLDLLRHTDRIPRMVADHFVPRLPVVSTLFARCGVVSGTRANVGRLFEQGELIVVFPEGTSGPAKPFRERYQIQHWRVGFAEHAIRYAAPVIPVAIIGAEESWPVLARLRALRPFGAPYLPIPVTPLPLPARFHIHYGEPIELSPSDAEDPTAVAAAAAVVRGAVGDLVRIGLTERQGVFR